MSTPPRTTTVEITRSPRSLNEALDIIKTRQADSDDAAIELKNVETSRLEALADKLRPLFDQIDPGDERFQLALAKGERPRLWLDMTSHVAMAPDRRTYRVSKDTRLGRLMLAETDDAEKAADAVSAYVAEKVLERERELEGDWVTMRSMPAAKQSVSSQPVAKPISAEEAARLAPKVPATNHQASTKNTNTGVQAAPQLPRKSLLSTIVAFIAGLCLALIAAAILAYAYLPADIFPALPQYITEPFK